MGRRAEYGQQLPEDATARSGDHDRGWVAPAAGVSAGAYLACPGPEGRSGRKPVQIGPPAGEGTAIGPAQKYRFLAYPCGLRNSPSHQATTGSGKRSSRKSSVYLKISFPGGPWNVQKRRYPLACRMAFKIGNIIFTGS